MMLLGGQKHLWVLLSTYTTLIYCIALARLNILLVVVSLERAQCLAALVSIELFFLSFHRFGPSGPRAMRTNI